MRIGSPSTVFFDFDGTIADTLALTIRLFNRVADHYDLPSIHDEDIEKLRSTSPRELLNLFPLSPWKLLLLIRDIQKGIKEEIGNVLPIPGMEDVLRNLHNSGIHTGIVTSNSQENVELFLQRQKIDGIEFVHSEKNIFGKGQVLAKILKERKIPLDSVVYVGDEVRDIEAARIAKIPIISVSWGFNAKERLLQSDPDYLVETPAELLALLSKG
jgi:phosphoglycolate phosphatase-like HAD superfamily hydrolase